MTTTHVWKGAEALGELLVPIASLKPDPRNARDHSARNLEAIRASLDRFGQMKPAVVTEDGTVIAGNGLFSCARDMGWTHLAVTTANGFSEAEAIAYALADNRAGELATWEHDTLRELAAELAAVDRALFIGFADAEMDALMRGWKPQGFGLTFNERRYADSKQQMKDELLFRITITCNNEEHQRELCNKLRQEGLICQLSVS